MNSFGAVAGPVNATVFVELPPMEGAAAQDAFAAGVGGSAADALSSGDSDTALALSSGAASLLNKMSARRRRSLADGEDAGGGARVQLRASLLSIVSDTVAVRAAIDSSALEATAATVAAIAGAPSELSDSAQTAALSVLSRLAAERGAITASGAASIANGLSGVVGAAVSTLSSARRRRRSLRELADGDDSALLAVAAGRVSAAMAAVDNLATALGGLAAVPGEAPVKITSPAIQMSLQLAATGAGSSLGSGAITAPGSGAAFSALPDEAVRALSASDPNGTRGVRMQFVSTAFDPFDPQSLLQASEEEDPAAGLGSGGGVTRLEFQNPETGRQVPVQNLKTPIVFSIPAPEAVLGAGGAGGGQQGACQFWDETKKAYRRGGGVSLSPLLPLWFPQICLPPPPGAETRFCPLFNRRYLIPFRSLLLQHRRLCEPPQPAAPRTRHPVDGPIRWELDPLLLEHHRCAPGAVR